MLLWHQSTLAGDADVRKWANNSEYALYALLTADLLQTRQIRDRDDVQEQNDWACGKNPEDGCIAVWWAVKYGAAYWINHQANLTHMQRYKYNMFLNAWTFRVVRSNRIHFDLRIKF